MRDNSYALLIVTHKDDRPEGMTKKQIAAELVREKKCTKRIDKAITNFNKELIAINKEFPDAGVFDTMTRDIIHERLIEIAL